MSGAAPSLRSLWFGDGLTSATTQESGRNSDTRRAIRENHWTRLPRADVTKANGRMSQCGRFRLCRNERVRQVEVVTGAPREGRFYASVARRPHNPPAHTD